MFGLHIGESGQILTVHIAALDANKSTICNTASAKKSPGPSCGFNSGYKKRLNKYHCFILIPVLKASANLGKLFFMILSTNCGKCTETIPGPDTWSLGVKK